MFPLKSVLITICSMRILTLIFVVFIVLGNSAVSHASPLIFRATKEVTSTDLIELGNFDASKYRQIRITIKQPNKSLGNLPLSKSIAEIELNSAKRELERKSQLLGEGVISRADYDIAKERLERAQSIYDRSVETVYPPISIYGVEGTEEILIASFDERNITNTIIIDSPPTKISIKVFGKGTYKVFAWASL